MEFLSLRRRRLSRRSVPGVEERGETAVFAGLRYPSVHKNTISLSTLFVCIVISPVFCCCKTCLWCEELGSACFGSKKIASSSQVLPRLKLVRFLFKGNIRTKRSPKGFYALANSLNSRGEFSFMFLLPYRAIFV